MEAGTNAISRTSQTGRGQRPGGANRRESPRPVAHRKLARPGHRFAECLLCPARTPVYGRAVGLIRRTAGCGPACPVVWQGRRGDPSPYADFAAISWLTALTRPAICIREITIEE